MSCEKKKTINIDTTTLLHHINYIRGELLDVFYKINVNNFRRAMAYLALAYLMKAFEDMTREALCLVATHFEKL